MTYHHAMATDPLDRFTHVSAPPTNSDHATDLDPIVLSGQWDGRRDLFGDASTSSADLMGCETELD